MPKVILRVLKAAFLRFGAYSKRFENKKAPYQLVVRLLLDEHMIFG
jgi:hypothetical protein